METESIGSIRKSTANWQRWLPLVGYVVVLVVVWVYRNELLTWIRSGDVSPVVILLIVMGLACVPVIPYSVVIGTMGYLYGPLLGALISLTGAWLSALLMYGVFRYALRDRARSALRRYRLTEQWASLIERRPFRSILLARLIPIIPQSGVNAYAAAVGIPFPIYAAASILGKAPGMFIFAFIGGRIAGDRRSLIIVIVFYALFLLAIYVGSRIWMRKGKGRPQS